MAAMLKRLSCYSEPARPSRRKATRKPADGLVTVAAARGEETPARIGDVSTHGCSLMAEADWLRAGRFVSLAMDDAEPVQAVIRWARDGRVGLEFLRPLPPGPGAWQDLAESIWGS